MSSAAPRNELASFTSFRHNRLLIHTTCSTRRRRMADSVDFARQVISGAVKPTAAKALEHADALQAAGKFDLARQVLAAVDVGRGDPDYARVKQQLALSTYKDKDLPSPHRLHEALDILRDALDLDTTRDTETLGLAGAIYKLLWHDGGQRVHIEKSYSF